jgi:hypothetical protein
VLVRLDLPFADVRASDLALAFDAPVQPALEVLRLEEGRFPLELRLLGSSHQAIVAGVVSETVACGIAADGGLPPRAGREAAGAIYSFTARIQRFEPFAYAAAARRAISAAAADPQGLVGLFPIRAAAAGGADAAGGAEAAGEAFTALRAKVLPRGVTWDTWHGYPQSGELVVTRSALREPAPDRRVEAA